MRRAQYTVLFLLAAVLAFLAFNLLRRSSAEGPVARGRHLSAWVETLGRGTSDGALQYEAEAAILQLGTNCFPHILRWIQSEKTPWRYQLPAPAASFVAGNRALDNLLRARAEMRLEGCLTAFHLLRTNANSATIAELTRLVNATNAPKTAQRAACFLADTGATGATPLVQILETPNHPMRGLVVRLFLVFQALDAAGETAVPGLIKCLTETSNQTAPIAAAVLGRVKARPDVTVPALVNSLVSPDPNLRRAAAMALSSFPDQAELWQRPLAALLTDSDELVRQNATNTLQKVVPAALTNRPTQ